MITVFADCYLADVSTRRMCKLVKALGISSLSKSRMSRSAVELGERAEHFRHRLCGTQARSPSSPPTSSS